MPAGVNEYAEIKLKFPQKYDIVLIKKAVTITTFGVDILMNSSLCKVLSSQATNLVLLNHEQGHYDITALGAREFHNGLEGMTASSEDALKTKVKKLRDEIQKKIDTANSNYDTQTNHSLNKSVQQAWDQKIDSAKKNIKGTLNDLP
jgi:ATP-dependent Clp protease adapter protein ClpS